MGKGVGKFFGAERHIRYAAVHIQGQAYDDRDRLVFRNQRIQLGPISGVAIFGAYGMQSA